MVSFIFFCKVYISCTCVGDVFIYFRNLFSLDTYWRRRGSCFCFAFPCLCMKKMHCSPTSMLLFFKVVEISKLAFKHHFSKEKFDNKKWETLEGNLATSFQFYHMNWITRPTKHCSSIIRPLWVCWNCSSMKTALTLLLLLNFVHHTSRKSFCSRS